MSAKKSSFGRTYLISVPVIALVTLLLIVLGARFIWAPSEIRKIDNVNNTYIDKTSVVLSSDTDPQSREETVDLLNFVNNIDSYSANVKLPDGSYLVEMPAEKQELIDKAINDMPGLIGSEDLLGFTKYRAEVKTFESPAFNGTVTVAIVFEDQLYQIYKDESVRVGLLSICVGIPIGSGFLFGLIPAFISRKKSLKRTDSLSGYSLG